MAMNSTALFGFLNPVAKSVKAVTKVSSNNYIDVLIKAVTLTNALLSSNQTPTASEIKALAAFNGFGKAAKAFDTSSKHNHALQSAFNSVSEYESAKRSLLNSYFTPDFIAKAMWRGASRLGVTSGTMLVLSQI